MAEIDPRWVNGTLFENCNCQLPCPAHVSFMALLFAGGVMNLAWMAGLTALVFAEKILPHGAAIAKVSGAAMVGTAIWLAI